MYAACPPGFGLPWDGLSHREGALEVFLDEPGVDPFGHGEQDAAVGAGEYRLLGFARPAAAVRSSNS